MKASCTEHGLTPSSFILHASSFSSLPSHSDLTQLRTAGLKLARMPVGRGCAPAPLRTGSGVHTYDGSSFTTVGRIPWGGPSRRKRVWTSDTWKRARHAHSCLVTHASCPARLSTQDSELDRSKGRLPRVLHSIAATLKTSVFRGPDVSATVRHPRRRRTPEFIYNQTTPGGFHVKKITAEYIWIDGQKPTAKLRSKTKIIDPVKSLADVPEWGYDGSSTSQATGHFSDLMLRPVKQIPDPLHRDGDILVLCEVLNPDGSVHWSNTRAHLREVAEKYKEHDPWFGIEQEYTFFDGNRPLGWPDHGFPAPQGGYYCGVGADEVFGRDVVEAHADASLRAGISIVRTNAQVMPGQWEFQIGALVPLDVADELWIARW